MNRQWLLLLCAWARGAVIVLLTVLAAGALILGTAVGRQALLDVVSRLTAADDFALEMHGLELGPQWTLERLAMADRTGEWLEIEDIRLQPILSELLRGRVSLRHLGIGRINLDRLPAGDDSRNRPTLPTLRVAAIEAPRIRIGSAVVGHEALLSLHGGIGHEPDETVVRLRMARLDRQGDRIDLDGRLRDRVADMRLDLREEPGGLLHVLLGLNGTQGISLRAAGAGPVRSWPLTLHATVSDAGQLSGNATLEMLETPRLSMTAVFSPGSSWTHLTGLPHDPVVLGGQALFQGDTAHVTRLEARSPLTNLESNATWDMHAGVLDALASLRGADLRAIMPSGVTPGEAEAQVRIRMDDSGLRILAKTSLRDWDVSGQRVAAESDISFLRPAQSGSWDVEADIHARTPGLPDGLDDWSANATMGATTEGLFLHELNLTSRLAKLSANGALDSDLRLQARMQLHASKDLPVSTTLESTLSGVLDRDSQSLAGRLEVTASDLAGLPEPVATLLGSAPRLSIQALLSPQRIQIAQARLEAGSSAALDGEMNLDAGDFTAAWSATLPAMDFAAMRTPRQATINGAATGTTDSFDLNLALLAPELELAGQTLTAVNATAVLNGLPDPRTVTLAARAVADGQPASLNLRAGAIGKTLRVHEGRLRIPGSELLAVLSVIPETMSLDGNASLTSTDLLPLGRILGLDLSGEAQLLTTFSQDANRQAVRFQGRGRSLSARGIRIGEAVLHGTGTMPDIMDGAAAKLTLRSVRASGLSADRLDLDLRGADRGLIFRLDLADPDSRTHLTSSGTLAADWSGLRLQEARGSMLGQDLRLESPLNLELTATGGSWDETSLRLGQARLASRGRIAPDETRITASLANMNTAMLRPLFPHLPEADIMADLEIRGTRQAPEARLRLRTDSIRIVSPGLAPPPGLGGAAEIHLTRNVLEATAHVASSSDIFLEAEFTAPVHAELFSLDFPPGRALSGHIQGHGDLALLPLLLQLDDQSMEGTGDLDFRIAGAWDDPRLLGTATVRSARYENFRSGTIIEDVSLDAAATGADIKARASGTDGGQGRITANGAADLKALSYSCGARLAGFRILRQDLVQGTASGDLLLQGASDGAGLSGSLVLDPTDVRLPTSTSPDATRIDIREINSTMPAPSTPRTPRFRLNMDLEVAFPGRLSVRGRGLDSEWRGRLRVGGDQLRPALSGQMDLVRGAFVFLDRAFELTRGTLFLAGDTPPNPYIDIIGETRLADTQVQVFLTGPARDFRLSLASVPSLPQDELLSLILFGRSLRQISPFQAVRLAQAAAQMSGIQGVSLDFLDSIKSGLGLREVEVGRDDDDNTAVGVGGYVGGKYYVRTQRNVSGQDRTRVEIQLTPTISVETEVGSDSRQGGGVSWRHDY